MGKGYEVVVEALNGHAKALDGLSDELSGVHKTAASVELTGEAYGQTAQQAASLIRAHALAGQAVLEAAVAALSAEAANVRKGAQEYEARERKGVEDLNRSGGPR